MKNMKIRLTGAVMKDIQIPSDDSTNNLKLLDYSKLDNRWYYKS